MQDRKDTSTYWDERAAPYLGTSDPWRAVSATGLPLGVGRLIQRIEERGIRTIVRELPKDGCVADVGCGYGRWFSVVSRSHKLVGMELSPFLAYAAGSQSERIPVVRADIRHPPFRPNILSAVYSVKVLQFLPHEHRPGAIAAVVAAIAPGGRLILYEKTRGSDGSPPEDWIRWTDQGGGRLLAWYGNHYALLDRLVVAVSRHADSSLQAASGETAPFRERHRAWFWLHERIRELVLTLSLPIEPVLERLAPRPWADHGIFVFEKR